MRTMTMRHPAAPISPAGVPAWHGSELGVAVWRRVAQPALAEVWHGQAPLGAMQMQSVYDRQVDFLSGLSVASVSRAHETLKPAGPDRVFLRQTV
jgi:hypothetical protein